METLATLGYNGQLLATQQKIGVTVETLATLSYNGQLLATQQQLGGDGGDSGNPGLQRATAGNSATPVRGWWRLWQPWATTGNCWQLSNSCEGMVENLATLGYNRQLLATQQQIGVTVETLATLGYNGQLLATQQQLGGDGGDSGNPGLQRATASNSATTGRGWWRLWQHWATTGNYWQL